MKDTIAAIATPEGFGAISVIRMSGKHIMTSAGQILRLHNKPFSQIKTRHATVANVVHPFTGDVIDEVLVTYFKQPNSFTGEDVLEIGCHGNPLVVKSILEAIFLTGARPAEPGEFTRRAFENQRIDLTRAEAVALMTTSESTRARKAALQVLNGGLSEPANDVRTHITEIRTAIELELDFPDEDDGVSADVITNHLDKADSILKNLLSSGNLGDQFRTHHNVVIAGNVNAGKSTLFNKLTGRNRAIVSDEPGTTRDVLETAVEWHGCTLTLIDTAGIRSSLSAAETEAVRRTSMVLQHASLIIYVIDGYNPSLKMLENIIRDSNESAIFVFWNKNDLNKPKQNDIDVLSRNKHVTGFIQGSAKHDIGVETLRSNISSAIVNSSENFTESFLMLSARQTSALESASKLIHEIKQLYTTGVDLECIVPLLKETDYQMGLILGDTVSPDILSHIFSNFCIGK
jgi:tRNA modification GTPase